jgi:hypothetical protein
MDNRLWGLRFAVLVVVAAGCGESPLDPSGGHGAGGSAGGATDAGGSAGSAMGAGGSAGGGAGGSDQVFSVPPSFTPAIAADLCSRAFGERLTVSSIADMRYRLSRVWVLCSDPSVTPFHVPEVGISISNDRYAFLAWSAQGRLVQLRGAQNEGSLQYDDLGLVAGQEDIQVSFVSDLGLTIIAAPPILSVDPRFLYINNEGVEIYTYVQAPEVP